MTVAPERADGHSLRWNPVKELKDDFLLICIRAPREAVESGEGIESQKITQKPREPRREVESGEGIERS